jgi:cyclopropane-fatty-acyl-phospholipid synthase
LAIAINAFERAPLGDRLVRTGIEAFCARTHRRLVDLPDSYEHDFTRAMKQFPIAVHTDIANRQHYEIPAEFFAAILGPQRKYSCCFYATDGRDTLEQAEERALRATCSQADLQNGMRILELGCGWGSLSLHMARSYPAARIVCVSNSRAQRDHIVGAAEREGLTNLHVITADVNNFHALDRFDRIVSVEMFEHMSNWHSLLERTRNWLTPDGKLFIHIFTHASRSYRFDASDPADWIGRHFFSGGIMPACDLPYRFSDLYTVEQEVRWPGHHYRATALHWLDNFDRNIDRIRPIFTNIYGKNAALWMRRWRLFFMSTAELFGYRNGSVWGVGHYLMSPVR